MLITSDASFRTYFICTEERIGVLGTVTTPAGTFRLFRLPATDFLTPPNWVYLNHDQYNRLRSRHGNETRLFQECERLASEAKSRFDINLFNIDRELTPIQIGQRYLGIMPYSEAAMSMKIAGRLMQYELNRYTTNLYGLDGRPFSSSVTPGEAGIICEDGVYSAHMILTVE